MSAERVLQAAVVTALRDDSAYMALVKEVYDGEAPAGSAYPFTLIGDLTEAGEQTHDQRGFQHTLTIHDWSEYDGRKECQEIREARSDVLQNTALAVSGWGLTKLVYEFGEILLERDHDLDITRRHQVTRHRCFSLEAV